MFKTVVTKLINIIAPIISNRELMPSVYLMWLECPEIASVAHPGQYVMLSSGEDTLLRRPLSIHQVDGGKIALLFSVVGKGTYWLSQCQFGVSLDLLGPLGNGFTIDGGSKNLLLLAGGIGIAPLQFLAQEAVKQGFDVTLILGAKTASELYPQSLLPAGISCIVATDDGTAGEKGLLTDLLPRYTDGCDQIFTCGPMAMYRAMAKDITQFAGKPVQVSLEMRMACGFGVCYGCTIRTKNGLKQVCKDGPVFNLGDIVWDELIP